LHFIDGLREDIKAIVKVQRPSVLDTACVLAQLQEEVLEPVKKKEFRKPELFSPGWAAVKGVFPLPIPPRVDKGGTSLQPGDRRSADSVRQWPLDDKMASLRAYRCAHGLCEKCAEKWSRDHRCSEQIQLHALQEIWDLYQSDDSVDGVSSPESSMSDGQLMSLSLAAVQGTSCPHTIQFRGSIQQHEVLILLDSGSSNTFVSSDLASQLQGLSHLTSPVAVKVADGGLLHYTSYFPVLQWETNGCLF